ncbi:hypothetical protein [Sphingobacterium sp. UBA5996]|uniref:hypothetical protein n=1 Tax=Sphingobacterium sp. UBA5996 TaxID=1947505 RepID=UPI0025DB4D0C|nr:hypothetical protein [Sphingobacterium sp. UBA5996]
MEKKSISIHFKLHKIQTLQFATIGEAPDLSPTLPSQQTIEVLFETYENTNLISCIMDYTILDKERPFIKIKVSCEFEMNGDDLESLSDKDKNHITLPRNFAKHLAEITLGTARGILHEKTADTPFNKYLVGVLELNTMFKEDVVV